MALEDVLRENTDAINRLTAVTENLMNLRTEAIDAVKDAGKTGKAKPKREITENPENRKDPEVDEKPKAKTSKPKEPSGDADYDGLGDVIKAYVGFDDDKDRRAERAGNVKKIFGHDKIKAKKHTDVPEAMIKAVISNIKKLHDKAVEEAGESGSDDGDDLLA